MAHSLVCLIPHGSIRDRNLLIRPTLLHNSSGQAVHKQVQRDEQLDFLILFCKSSYSETEQSSLSVTVAHRRLLLDIASVVSAAQKVNWKAVYS